MSILAIQQIAFSLGIAVRHANRRAALENWPYREQRHGKTTRRVYRLKSLPEPVQQALLAMETRSITEPCSRSTMEEASAGESKSNEAAVLKGWQQARMEARAALLTELERLAGTVGLKRAAGELVTRARGGDLPDHLQRLVPVALAKRSGAGRLSLRTLLRWRAAAKGGAGALAPRPTERGSLPPWASMLLRIYRQPQKRSLADVLRDLHQPGMLPNDVAPPSYAQARRFIASLGEVERQRGRLGKRELKALQPFKRRDFSHMWPADCYSADGHTFDAEVAHPEHGRPFRPELTAFVDIATRRVVGWSATLSESAITTLDALGHACRTGGIPALLYVDKGSGFNNHLLEGPATGVLGRLGIELTNSVPYNSQARGVVERLHKTLWVPLAKRLFTYMGADMDPEAKNLAFKVTRRTGQGLLPWAIFLERAASGVDEYNRRPHSNLPRITDPVTGKRRHPSPLEAWEAARTQRWAPEVVEDAALFLPRLTRTVRRGEVRLPWGRYFSADLTEWHRRQVHVGYDIQDGARAWVYDPDGPLLAVAKRHANHTEYFPESRLEQARQQRAAARLRRLEIKADEIEAEAGRAAAAEPTPATPEERVAAAAYLEAHQPAEPPPPVDTSPGASRPYFAGEWAERDWGRWVMNNLDQVDAEEQTEFFRRVGESPSFRLLIGYRDPVTDSHSRGEQRGWIPLYSTEGS